VDRDIGEELMDVMNKMYVNGDKAKKQELEEAYVKAQKKQAKGPFQ
jgi:hypothetical protein